MTPKPPVPTEQRQKPRTPRAPEPQIENRKARYSYEILDTIEAGIVLMGSEIKSIRAGNVSLREAYARFRDGELWLVNLHIPAYRAAALFGHEPRRDRKLLLHRNELIRLGIRIKEEGLALVPLRLVFRRSMAKIVLGVGKGKKMWDKRRAIAERSAKGDIARYARG